MANDSSKGVCINCYNLHFPPYKKRELCRKKKKEPKKNNNNEKKKKNKQ